MQWFLIVWKKQIWSFAINAEISPVDRDGFRLLFQIASDCNERRSIILLTTNLEFSQWVTIFYEEQTPAAMIDISVHYSHLLVFDGESWRTKKSLIRK